MDNNERLAQKYKYLREKIIINYNKGCKILNIVKHVVFVAFILFTLLAIHLSHNSNDKTQWLFWWIMVVIANVFVFLITDYCKFLVKDKVIPYLLDDSQLEFKEYEIFKDDDEIDEFEEVEKK